MGSPESLVHLVYIYFKASKQLNYINTYFCALLQMGEQVAESYCQQRDYIKLMLCC